VVNIRHARELVRSLSDETRLRILSLLDHEDEISVGEFCDILKSAQSMISKHLMRLRLLGLVTDRRAGLSVFYRLCDIKEPVYRTIVISVTKSFEDFDVFEEDRNKMDEIRGR
jgi:DNA-binding transcriptional ArsR family regulator